MLSNTFHMLCLFFRRSNTPVSRSTHKYRSSNQNGSQFLHKRQRDIYNGWKYGRQVMFSGDGGFYIRLRNVTIVG
jgi:hypothetical protein